MRTTTLMLLITGLILLPTAAFAQDEATEEEEEQGVEWDEGSDSKPTLEENATEEEEEETDGGKLEIGEPNVDPPIPCTVTWVDGRSKSGNLTHVFRTEDWYGHDPKKATEVELKAGSHLFNVAWKDIASISVARPNTSSDMDCYSDEDKDPILWECTLEQRSTVRMKTKHQYSDTYYVSTRENWVFVWDDDASTKETLVLYKLVANTQNYESMSEALSRLQKLLKEKNQAAVKSISFQ